jgi:hypothetical protein
MNGAGYDDGHIGDRWYNPGDVLIVKLRLENWSKAKLARIGNLQSGLKPAKCGDEHGNNYRLIPVSSEWIFPIRSKPQHDGNKEDTGAEKGPEAFHGATVYPWKAMTTHLLFEKPVDAAKEVKIIIPGSAVGSADDLLLRVPVIR